MLPCLIILYHAWYVTYNNNNKRSKYGCGLLYKVIKENMQCGDRRRINVFVSLKKV